MVIDPLVVKLSEDLRIDLTTIALLVIMDMTPPSGGGYRMTINSYKQIIEITRAYG
jgi:hypothetical protein